MRLVTIKCKAKTVVGGDIYSGAPSFRSLADTQCMNKWAEVS